MKNKAKRAWSVNDPMPSGLGGEWQQPMTIVGDKDPIEWEDLSQYDGCQVIPGLKEEMDRVMSDIARKIKNKEWFSND